MIFIDFTGEQVVDGVLRSRRMLFALQRRRLHWQILREYPTLAQSDSVWWMVFVVTINFAICFLAAFPVL